jgi:hypothetical protein
VVTRSIPIARQAGRAVDGGETRPLPRMAADTVVAAGAEAKAVHDQSPVQPQLLVSLA